jgi:hypothetical protein
MITSDHVLPTVQELQKRLVLAEAQKRRKTLATPRPRRRRKRRNAASLYWDVVLQRGNEYRVHLAETIPPVLEFAFELVAVNEDLTL